MPRKTNFSTNGKDYYRITATLGKTADGKPIRKQFYGASKKEAETKREEYLSGLKQGLAVEYEKTTFSAAFEHWLEHIQRQKIAISSYARYKGVYQLHIAHSGLAGMRLIDIKAANVQGHYNTLLKTTTATAIHYLNRILKIFFKYCLKSGILVKSPLLAVELPMLPKQHTTKNTALSDDEIKKMVQAAKENIRYFPFVFDIFTGLRSGELRALCYKDLDFKTNMVNVKRTVNHITVDGEYKAVLSDTKSKASIRRVPIMKEIQHLLQAHIKEIISRLDSIPIDGNFLLFPSATGEYREEGSLLYFYKRLCDKLDIREGRTIHSLRHTYCTIVARQGVSLLEASRLMGHSNINITAKIYAHVTDADKMNAVEKLSVYFD